MGVKLIPSLISTIIFSTICKLQPIMFNSLNILIIIHVNIISKQRKIPNSNPTATTLKIKFTYITMKKTHQAQPSILPQIQKEK